MFASVQDEQPGASRGWIRPPEDGSPRRKLA